MSGFKSLFQRELDDDSSSSSDDYFIIAAAWIVQTFLGQKRRPGGSIPSHVVIYRDRESEHNRMFQDYLAVNPTYDPHIFCWRLLLFHFGLVRTMCWIIIRFVKVYIVCFRYRMSRELFLCIMNVVKAHDDYFVQKIMRTMYLNWVASKKSPPHFVCSVMAFQPI
jgi:hypothetical protein